MADIAGLWLKVRNRVLADTGAGGLYAPGAPLVYGIYFNTWPESAQLPMLVFDHAADNQIDAQRRAVYEVDFRIGIYVKRDPVESVEAIKLASKIRARVRGDWQDQSVGTAPTYGFHRWAPGDFADSEWNGRDTRHLGTQVNHNDTVWHFIENFRVLVQQAAA